MTPPAARSATPGTTGGCSSGASGERRKSTRPGPRRDPVAGRRSVPALPFIPGSRSPQNAAGPPRRRLAGGPTPDTPARVVDSHSVGRLVIFIERSEIDAGRPRSRPPAASAHAPPRARAAVPSTRTCLPMMTRHSTEKTLPREGVSPAPAAEGPRVSVIVPAHDAEATLGDTLASLRAQTLADLEAVVVDDASADGTRALAAGRRGRRTRASGCSPCRPTSAPPAPATPACARPAAAGSCSSTPTTGSTPTTSPPWSRPPRPTRAPTARSAATATRPPTAGSAGRSGRGWRATCSGPRRGAARSRSTPASSAARPRSPSAASTRTSGRSRTGTSGSGSAAPAGASSRPGRPARSTACAPARRCAGPRPATSSAASRSSGAATRPTRGCPRRTRTTRRGGRPRSCRGPRPLPALPARQQARARGRRGRGAGPLRGPGAGRAGAGRGGGGDRPRPPGRRRLPAGGRAGAVGAARGRHRGGARPAGAAAGEPDLGGALRLALARQLGGPPRAAGRLPSRVGEVHAVRLGRRRRFADLPVPAGTRVLRAYLAAGGARSSCRWSPAPRPCRPGSWRGPSLAVRGPELARRALREGLARAATLRRLLRLALRPRGRRLRSPTWRGLPRAERRPRPGGVRGRLAALAAARAEGRPAGRAPGGAEARTGHGDARARWERLLRRARTRGGTRPAPTSAPSTRTRSRSCRRGGSGARSSSPARRATSPPSSRPASTTCSPPTSRPRRWAGPRSAAAACRTSASRRSTSPATRCPAASA